jgi:hypothetical protein
MTRKWLLTLLTGAAIALAASPGRSEIAASIEYDVVPPPASLPADLQPHDGMSLKFLAIKAIDGYASTPRCGSRTARSLSRRRWS